MKNGVRVLLVGIGLLLTLMLLFSFQQPNEDKQGFPSGFIVKKSTITVPDKGLRETDKYPQPETIKRVIPDDVDQAIKLAGVLIDNGLKSALIVIGNSRDYYTEQQKITETVTLEHISSTYVQIRRNDRLEMILLSLVATSSQPEVKDNISRPPSTINTSNSSGDFKGVQEHFDGFYYLESDFLTTLNIADIAGQITVANDFDENILITGITEGSVIEALGLRVGDTMLSINGTTIKSLENVVESIGYLSKGVSLDLEIERFGQLRHQYYTVILP